MLYALLVGIDHYQAPVPPLNGCKNDIDAILAYLRERAGSTRAFELKALVLKDEAATYDAVVGGFRQHFGAATRDDVALFYYSGHGSQEQTPSEYLPLEPDRLDETLVLYDSRSPGRHDLADKELGALITEAAARAGHVTVVLDCCHSGSGTRDPEDDGLVTREAPFDLRPRPPQSFFFHGDPALDPLEGTRDLERGSTPLGQARHVLLAACRSSETAKEVRVDGQARGAFSAALLGALVSLGPGASYRDLAKRAGSRVLTLARRQTPQLEAVVGADLDGGFLGGQVPPRGTSFTLFHHPEQGWVIDGGAIYGVRMTSLAETTTLALFGAGSTAEDWTDPGRALGTARVTQVQPELSRVTLPGDIPLDPEQTYAAVVTDQPVLALGVQLEDGGDGTAARRVREAIENARGPGQASLLVRVVEDPEDAAFRVRVRDGGFTLTRVGSDRRLDRLATDLPGLDEESAGTVVARLEHMARWHLTMGLENPSSGLQRAGAVGLEMFSANGAPGAGNVLSPAPGENGVVLRYGPGTSDPPAYRLRVRNTGRVPLYCTLLYLDESYGIHADLLRGAWLGPSEEAWAFGGEPVQSWVPDAWFAAGILEVHDRVKLIASTAEFDAELLTQPELGLAVTRNLRDVPEPGSTLARLLQQVAGVRAGGQRASSPLADWMVTDLDITTVRSAGDQEVPGPGASVQLGPNVTLDGHPALRGHARLTNLPQVSRDLSARPVPPALAAAPGAWVPWPLSQERGDLPLAALELNGIRNPGAVTPQQPLTLRVDGVTLGPGEHVVATAWDPETGLHLPVGVGHTDTDRNGVTFGLQRLPAPITERSLVGAVRILFTKFAAGRLGLDYPYPLLRAVDVTPDGGLMSSEPYQVAERAAMADRILLLVHGIVGDGESLARSLTSEHLRLGSPYDLTLTFDYESVNDGIAKNAADLKAVLKGVGLGEEHGKTLHVVAHSMGGLVTRYFVEQLAGNRVVQGLVMLGTPNGGSPWPSVQGWATTVLAAGLNMLGTVAWPVSALSGLLGLIEKVDRNLDELQPGSAVLEGLEAAADPGVPYVLIVGDTSLDAQRQPLLERVARRLGTQTVFLSQANDLAVGVASAMNVGERRQPAPVRVSPVACDHMSYFLSGAGLSALGTALAALGTGPARQEVTAATGTDSA